MDGHDLYRAHRADWFSLKYTLEFTVVSWHQAARALGVILDNHVLAGGQAERQQVLAAGAVELGLRNIEAAGWARSHRLCLILSLNWAPGDAFDLGLELWWDLLNVLRSNQNACPVVSLALESRLRALTNATSHDIAHVLREE